MKTFNRSVKSIESKRGLFFRIGLTCSLLITFLAFEWRTPVARIEVEPFHEWDLIEEEQMPVTYSQSEIIAPPATAFPQPQLATVDIQIIPDDVIIEPSPDPVLPADIIPIITPVEIDTSAEIIYYGAASMPEFPGGEIALKEYLESEIRYPEKAAKNQITGNVYIKFVIDETGNAINISCEYASDPIFSEEAMRVVEKMPLWHPGKQGGKEVKVYMSLPVKFSLK